MTCITRKEAIGKSVLASNIISVQPKIITATELIKRALSEHDKPSISFSGGKDSLVVLDLVRQQDQRVKGAFVNTGNEYKETVPYALSFPNIVELKPQKTFWQCVKEYGMPVSKAKAKSHGNQCCNWLKHKPFDEYYKTEGVNVVFTGLTAAESRQRRLTLIRMGAYYQKKADKIWYCHPIHNWTPGEVWAYIYINKLPYNPVYDMGIGRVGCRFCTAYKDWETTTGRYNEADTRLIQHKKGVIQITDF